MNLVNLAMVVLTPLLVGIYTFNYARWAWKQEFRRGAVGLYLLSALTVGGPLFTLWWNQ